MPSRFTKSETVCTLGEDSLATRPAPQNLESSSLGSVKEDFKRMTKTKLRVAGALCALALAGVAPAAAVAQTASQDGYDESGLLGSVETPGGGTPQTVSANSESGSSSLPFTGLDVGILLALGGTAAGAGYAMRRVLRQPAQ
jgi:hypothetical protein